MERAAVQGERTKDREQQSSEQAWGSGASGCNASSRSAIERFPARQRRRGIPDSRESVCSSVGLSGAAAVWQRSSPRLALRLIRLSFSPACVPAVRPASAAFAYCSLLKWNRDGGAGLLPACLLACEATVASSGGLAASSPQDFANTAQQHFSTPSSHTSQVAQEAGMTVQSLSD